MAEKEAEELLKKGLRRKERTHKKSPLATSSHPLPPFFLSPLSLIYWLQLSNYSFSVPSSRSPCTPFFPSPVLVFTPLLLPSHPIAYASTASLFSPPRPPLHLFSSCVFSFSSFVTCQPSHLTAIARLLIIPNHPFSSPFPPSYTLIFFAPIASPLPSPPSLHSLDRAPSPTLGTDSRTLSTFTLSLATLQLYSSSSV